MVGCTSPQISAHNRGKPPPTNDAIGEGEARAAQHRAHEQGERGGDGDGLRKNHVGIPAVESGGDTHLTAYSRASAEAAATMLRWVMVMGSLLLL